MGLGVTLIVVLAIVAFIWMFIEFKRFKHKFYAILIIALILFSYISASAVFKGKDINFGTVEGLFRATGLYFSWLVNVGKNIGTATASVIKMDWSSKESSTNITKPK